MMFEHHISPQKDKYTSKALDLDEIQVEVENGMKYVAVCFNGTGSSAHYSYAVSELLHEDVGYLRGGLGKVFSRIAQPSERERALTVLSKIPNLLVYSGDMVLAKEQYRQFISELKQKMKDNGTTYWNVSTPILQNEFQKSIARQVREV